MNPSTDSMPASTPTSAPAAPAAAAPQDAPILPLHRNANAASGFRGVYPYNKRWAAVIMRDGKKERIAICATPEEAAAHYARAMHNQRVAHKALFAELGTVEQDIMAKFSRGEALKRSDWESLASLPNDVELPTEILTQMRPTTQDAPPLHRIGRAATPIPPAPNARDDRS